MTAKQIEEAQKALPGFMKPMTQQQRCQHDELSCRNMINSCLIYGSARFGFYDPKTGQFGHYAKDYIKKLGEETVVRLYNEQAGDFSKAIVKYGVHTDSEGCTYNTCIWGDE